MNFLSNDWWAWLWTTYSMTIIAIPTVVTFLLKLWAIFDPKVPTDQIRDLFAEFWPKKEGSS